MRGSISSIWPGELLRHPRAWLWRLLLRLAAACREIARASRAPGVNWPARAGEVGWLRLWRRLVRRGGGLWPQRLARHLLVELDPREQLIRPRQPV